MNANHALEFKDVCVYYGDFRAVTNINMSILKNKVTAIIGPSGCGKSTLLRSINRMNEFVDGSYVTGQVMYRDQDITSQEIDAAEVRKSIGMVFQKPNPFPKTIYQNIIWGPKINGLLEDADELVERSLEGAGLWNEVKDRLHTSALELSGGQQQRLCIARAIAMSPDVILMDEPCSALDPKSTLRIEALIEQLKEHYTILMVTHNMQQASRVSDQTAFFYEGQLIEFDDTEIIFNSPAHQSTSDYIQGKFG
ncbi:MAG: phosphate ABC transporter ATP-binding protein [Bdellovibrionales bacterium]|nr:phosphate ABC transporter ATP-binding protein [Bdellovibrionales bacterium]